MYSKNSVDVAVAALKKGYEEGKKKRFAHNYDGMCDENAVKCFARTEKEKRWQK